MDWRSVYNRLAIVLRNLGHSQIPMVDLDKLDDGFELDVRAALFSDLPKSLGGRTNSINVLCGIARRFDKLGKTDAVLNILREANLLTGYRSPEDRKIFAKYAKDLEAL